MGAIIFAVPFIFIAVAGSIVTDIIVTKEKALEDATTSTRAKHY